jgi:hypothetical protein
MIDNWKISACLRSPLAGDPPFFDAILEYELALRLGMKHAGKMTRDISLSQIERPPIPLAKRTIGEIDIYCCSDPIMSPILSEWTDRSSRRFDSDLIASMLAPCHRKSLLTSSGPYKSRFAPMRIRLIERITWFVRGDKKEINKLAKKIIALGKHRNIGYGIIDRWEYERMEYDYSIFSPLNGQKILMKTIPAIGDNLNGIKGYIRSYGGGFPPYWHPETFMEIAKPC